MTEHLTRAKERARLARYGMYDPADEHDACGVGLVAAIDGKPRREVVEAGDRGAEGRLAPRRRRRRRQDRRRRRHPRADPAGLLPRARRGAPATIRARPAIGVGQIFLPRTDLAAQERCRTIVETEILRFGYYIYGWRQVPIDTSRHRREGERHAARDRADHDRQLAGDATTEQFERDLYVIRRRIEKRGARRRRSRTSTSARCPARSLIYKGMFLAEQLDRFYPDLQDERFVSPFAIFHQRYSTNTFPTWRLAQPFRMLAHNGEINTLRGNINWMKSHEIRMASDVFGAHVDDIKPVIQPGRSDSAALDTVFEVLVRAGRDRADGQDAADPRGVERATARCPQRIARLYAYCNCRDGAVGRPGGDLRATDGRWADRRHGPQRPAAAALHAHRRRPADRRLGDRHGAHRRAQHRREGPRRPRPDDRRRSGGGPALRRTRELKDLLAARHPYGDWVKQHRRARRPRSRPAPRAAPSPSSRDELRRRQVAAGLTMEDIELILPPMVEDGKEAVGSMGDDTPLAVLSDSYRGRCPTSSARTSARSPTRRSTPCARSG